MDNQAASAVMSEVRLAPRDLGKRILRRSKQLKSDRWHIENTLRECFDLTYPLRGAGFYVPAGSSSSASAMQSIANQRQAELLDGTSTRSARIFASAMVSGLVPSQTRWGESYVEEAEEADKQWLDEKSTVVWEWIHRSNFDSVVFECILDWVIAGYMYLFVDEQEGGGYKFEEWSIADTYSAASRAGGPLDTFYRHMSMTAEQAILEFGEEAVDKTVRDASLTEPDKTFEYVWAIYPREGGKANAKFGRNMPWASVVVEVATERTVRESGYHECPVIAPRSQVLPRSSYATGHVFDALPDIRQLQMVIRLNLAGLEMNIGGMWIAKDDGVLNPHSVKVGPRKVIIAADTDSVKPLITKTDMSQTLIEIERLQKAIKSALFADMLEPFEQMTNPETAVAARIRVQMIRQILGPNFGRMMAEMLAPLWKRCWGLAYRSGVLGVAPPNVAASEYGVKYTNPLARSARGEEVSAMDEFEQSLASVAEVEPGVLDIYKWDDAKRLRAELGGVPLNLIRTKDEVSSERAAMEEQRQAEEAQGRTDAVTMEAIKSQGGDPNAMAMAALAQAMGRPRDFKMKGRQIVGIR